MLLMVAFPLAQRKRQPLVREGTVFKKVSIFLQLWNLLVQLWKGPLHNCTLILIPHTVNMGKISMIIMANSTSGMIAFVVKKASDQEACQ
mgnify:CR=1 FL=1